MEVTASNWELTSMFMKFGMHSGRVMYFLTTCEGRQQWSFLYGLKVIFN